MTKQERQDAMIEVLAMMGLGLTLLHEIEAAFAAAVLFGITDKDRTSGKTINMLWADREKKTFGQLVATLRCEWHLDPLLDAFLMAFTTARNEFVHRMTKLPGHGMYYKRERERLKKRVLAFLEIAFAAREIMDVATLASMHVTADILSKGERPEFVPLTPELKSMVRDFLVLVHPRSHPTSRET